MWSQGRDTPSRCQTTSDLVWTKKLRMNRPKGQKLTETRAAFCVCTCISAPWGGNYLFYHSTKGNELPMRKDKV